MISVNEYSDTKYKFDSKTLQLFSYGDNNPGRLFMFIEAGAEISGLCAMIRRTISGLYMSCLFNATPYVSWEKSRLFNENRIINGSANPFEYFFERVSFVDRDNILKCKYVLNYESRLDSCIWNAGGCICMDGQPASYINLMRDIVKIYPLILKKVVKTDIDNEIGELFKGNRVLGVHMRGAQRKRNIEGLANPIPSAWYIEEIKQLLNKGYKKVFLATDDEEYLATLTREFGDIVLSFKDTQRYDGVKIPYFQNDIDKYRIGYETLRDMYALIESDGFLFGPSNVTMMCRVLNPHIEKWADCIMLDNGLCEKGEENLNNTKKIIENNGNLTVLDT